MARAGSGVFARESRRLLEHTVRSGDVCGRSATGSLLTLNDEAKAGRVVVAVAQLSDLGGNRIAPLQGPIEMVRDFGARIERERLGGLALGVPIDARFYAVPTAGVLFAARQLHQVAPVGW